MYNEKLKNDFVEYFRQKRPNDAVEFCISTFDACEGFENEWNADLCTRNAEQLAPMIEEIVGLRVKSKWKRIILLKEYVNWCIAIGVPDVSDGMLKIESVGLKKVRTQMVSSPVHLQKYLDEIFEPEREETVDNIYRCCFWLSYMGVAEEDIVSIKCSDVDLPKRVLYYKGEEIELYHVAVPAFKNAATLTAFRFKHPNYNDKVILRDRAEGDLLIRGIRNAPSTMAIRSELSRRSKKALEEGNTQSRVSLQRAKLSGVFYKKYELERAGCQVDFEDVAEEFIGDRIYKLDLGRNTQDAKKRQIMNDYLQDYQRWKAAFIV